MRYRAHCAFRDCGVDIVTIKIDMDGDGEDDIVVKTAKVKSAIIGFITFIGTCVAAILALV